MNYEIIRGNETTLSEAKEALINDVPWGSTYTPDCRFCGVYTGEGFVFRLTAYEKNPRITHFEPQSEVCEDSCLEIFLNFAPEKNDSYINFEMNAAGTTLFGIGPDRYERKDLICSVMPKVKAVVEEDKWHVTLFIPNETIFSVYGNIDFKSGYTFKGNAFKCGDLTEEEHYLSWAPLQRDAVDFHRSDRFGTFTLV